MPSPQYYRSDKSMLFGVCAGLAERFQMDVVLVRLFWVLAVFFGGLSIFVYFLLALSLPVKGQLDQAYSSRLMGVCLRISRRYNMEIGIVRFLALLGLFCSFGTGVVVYVIAHFLLPEDSVGVSS